MRNGFLAITILFLLAAVARAQSAAPTKPATGESDRLDIEKLESKYWSAKDDDFSVVQNRAFTKAGRFFASLSSGFPINDPYSSGNLTNLSVGYYWSERLGVEYSNMATSFRDNDATDQFIKDHGTIPNHNTLLGTQTLILNVVPLYAKMSLLDKKIIYFDMGFGIGFGQTSYESQIVTGDRRATSSHYLFDIHQHYFFSEHFALKLTFRNLWTTEERFRYKLNIGEPESSRSLGNKTINDTSLLFGVTLWY